MMYKVIETSDVVTAIRENINSEGFVIIKSKRIKKIKQYPFSNIVLIPSSFSNDLFDLIKHNLVIYKSLKNSELLRLNIQ